MNNLDIARNLVESLHKKLDELQHFQEIQLNAVEIERLYNLSKETPNNILIVKTTPTGIGSKITVSVPEGKVHDISDYESW